MNKYEYMLELENALRHLPREEREDALSYYREYFEDAGPGKEAEVIFTIAGVISIAAGLFFLPTQLANGIFILGTALAETGLGVFLILGGCAFCMGLFGGLAKQIKKLLTGGGK